MWFSQNNCIPDLKRYNFAVSRSIFGATLRSLGRQFHTYLRAATSMRNSSTARRAATSKSCLD